MFARCLTFRKKNTVNIEKDILVIFIPNEQF